MLQSAIRPHIVLSIWRIPAFIPLLFSIDAFSPVFLDIVRYICPKSKRKATDIKQLSSKIIMPGWS